MGQLRKLPLTLRTLGSVLVFITLSTTAQTTYTWTGAISTAWNNNFNWLPATGFPNGADTAVVLLTALNQPLLDANRSVNSLTITSGTLNLNAFTLNVTGTSNFIGGAVNNGTLAPNVAAGAITFAGTTFSCAINGTTDIVYFNGSVFNGPVTLTKTNTGNNYSIGGNTFNDSLTLTNTAGRQYMYYTLNDVYNGNVVLNSSGTSGGIWLGQNTGSGTLASGMTLSIGGGGFSIGSLVIGRLIQLGATPQSIITTGTSTLHVRDGSVFNGALTGSAPGLYIQNTTFNANATFIKTGNTNEYSSGGCVFNGTTEFSNSGIGFLALNNTGVDTFNGDVKFNSSGSGGFRFGYSGGSWDQASGYTIMIGAGGFSAGALGLGRFTQLGPSNITLVMTGTSSFFYNPGTLFLGNVDVTAPTVFLNGATFSGSAKFTKTGSSNDYSTGGNVFNGSMEFLNSSSALFCPHYTGIDVFNGPLLVNNTGTGSIRFGLSGGTSTLATGNTINVGASGFTSGQLYINGLTQVGATPQNIAFTGSAGIYFGSGTTFNGPLTVVSPSIGLNGSTFNADVSLTKTGSLNDVCTGGNTFNGTLDLTNTSTGTIYLYHYANDSFNGNIRFGSTSTGQILLGQFSGTATLAAGYTIAAGASGFVAGFLTIGKLTQVGGTAQDLMLGTNATLTFNAGTVLNGNVTATTGRLYFNGATFNGKLTAIKTGPGSDESNGGNVFNNIVDITNASNGAIILYQNFDDLFNNDVLLSNTSSGQILTGQLTGTATLAATRIISVGASGFASGALSIGRLTQIGSTAQNFVLGSSASLTFGVGNTFNGTVSSTSGRLYLNGTTFNDSFTAVKTGFGSDASNGGNTYNGPTEITLASAGIMYLYHYSDDAFNDDLLFNNTSTGQILMGQFTGNAVLAAGRVIEVGAGGFTNGMLNIGRFTQIGPTPQNLVLGNGAALAFGTGSVFNGNVISSSGSLFYHGTTFNGTVRSTKNGPGNDTSRGGNIFNGHTDITMTATGSMNLYSTANDIYNADLRLSNTSVGQFRLGLSTGTAILAAGYTIAVGPSGFTQGLLSIEELTQIGPTPQTLSLGNVATLTYGAGTTFNGDVTSTSGSLFFAGTTFNGRLTATKTGISNDSSPGGNTFNGLTVITQTGAGFINMHYTADDQFNADIRLNNTSTGQFRFGLNTGFGFLADGRTVAVGVTGFSAGALSLDRFIQLGPTPQAINLGANATLTYGIASVFNGNVVSSSGGLLFNGTTFNGTVQATKTGPSNDSSRGGNTFNGLTDIRMTGGGYLNMYYQVNDTYNADLLVSNSSTGQLRMGLNTGSAVLAAGRTISVGPLGFVNGLLSIEKFTQLGATPQSLTLTGGAILVFGGGAIFNGNMTSVSPGLRFTGARFNGDAYCRKIGPSNDSGVGTNMFNGATRLTNAGTGIFYLGYSGTELFNGDLALGSTSTGGIIFGQANGTATLATGRTLSIDPTGFTNGSLALRNFTQVGPNSHTLVLTGSAVLRFQTGTTFNGPLDATSPDVYLDGSVFNSYVRFVKNGPVYNPSYGGNTYNANMEFVGQGGTVLLSNYVADTYNGDAHFQHNGTAGFNLGNISGNNFYKDVSTLGSTSTILFSAGAGRTRFLGSVPQYFRNEIAYPPTVNLLDVATTSGAEVVLVGGNVNVALDLAFVSGALRTAAATSAGPGLLVIADNVTMSNPPDNNSHVIGYLRKVGDDAFSFPVGDGTRYAPISISALAGTSHHFTAKYEPQSSHPTYSHLLRDPSLNHLSLCEYWILDRTAGASNPVVTLSWDTPRSCGVTDLSELAVARWNGALWKNHGNGSTTGNTTAGTISSAGAVSLFATPSLFTLASTGFGNPLPVELVSFHAQYVEDAVRTEWTTASEMNNDRFDVERSADAFTFELAGSVFGAGNSQVALNYEFFDMHPYSGTSYYRLKQVDFDGTFTYSDIVPVHNPNGSDASITVFPNPTQGETIVSIQGTSEGTIELSVINAQGQQVLNYSRTATSTGFTVPVSLDGLPSGIYVVRVQEVGQDPVEVKVLKE
ncbi:MAG: T9SS type A sorting domain-containing protein [Flavobacteriales bacterium]|nr:T9SS type A sorting domain-containing protein [Flavobacteriales bacterium]